MMMKDEQVDSDEKENLFSAVGTFGWWVEREFRFDGILPVSVRDTDLHDSFLVGVLLRSMYIHQQYQVPGKDQ
jgi:hypothetical protein